MAALERVDLARGQVISEPGDRIRSILFPETCVLSLIQTYASGDSVETATIGCEGVLCSSTVMSGHDTAQLRHLVQIGGRALRVERAWFARAFARLPGLHAAVLKFNSDLLGTTFLSVACNRVHRVEQRLARWLLMAHDRSTGDELPLTHDMLAQMLGVHRPTVSVAARELERAGLIRYRRGVVVLLDRDGLEEAACECYAISRRDG